MEKKQRIGSLEEKYVKEVLKTCSCDGKWNSDTSYSIGGSRCWYCR